MREWLRKRECTQQCHRSYTWNQRLTRPCCVIPFFQCFEISWNVENGQHRWESRHNEEGQHCHLPNTCNIVTCTKYKLLCEFTQLYRRTRGIRNKKTISDSEYCRGRARAGPSLAYDSFASSVSLEKEKQSSTHNHKPHLCPQHCNHHDEVRKNVIPYALELRRSITYLQNCLINNRKTAIVVNMTRHVGKHGIQEVESMMYDTPFLWFS